MSNVDICSEESPMEMPETRNYVVVYQMGKVASTAIVATLNEIEGVEAVQSHFLGEKALAKTIPEITSANVPSYFFHNEFGQFIENVLITRRINLALAGMVPHQNLLVVSLCREPVEWIRSSVVQDISGYLPILRSLYERDDGEYIDDSGIVRYGLYTLVHNACDLLEKFGGVDQFLGSPLGYWERFEGSVLGTNLGAHRLFMMFMRPANWFEKHFEEALPVRLSNMHRRGSIWSAAQENASFAIVRYEDMAEALPEWLCAMGITGIIDFKRENLSDEKEYASEIASVFASDAAERLRLLYKQTAYSRFFGYD